MLSSSILFPKVIRSSTKKLTSIAYYSSSLENDLLEKSRVPTDHFQKSLPRLPIPELEKSCQRYLNAQKPLLSDDDFKRAEKILNDFKSNDGKRLHEELVAKNKINKGTSFISAPWSDMYLKDRRSVTLNHNPCMVFLDDHRPEYNKQIVRATNFVIASMKFLNSYRNNVLTPEIYHLNPTVSNTDKFKNFVRLLPKSVSWYGAYWYKAFPLDMSQFPKLFNSSRIPRPVKDELYSDYDARHIIVLHKGHFFAVDVLEIDGSIKPASVIMSALKTVVEKDISHAEDPIGIMTTQDRDTWTSVREKLVALGNENALKMIDGALFALVLDDKSIEDPREVVHEFLHSDGTNRWFDKSFSLIISENGKAAVNMEHAWGDGVAVLRYFNEIFADSKNNPRAHPDTELVNLDQQDVAKLDFTLDDEVKHDIQEATLAFSNTISSLSLDYHQYSGFGRKSLKKLKFSPDAFMQLAIQLAYYKQNQGTVPTYESCSTSAFKHGRTETIRSCTVATKEACERISSVTNQPSKSDLRVMMNNCSELHGNLVKEAAMGHGFDRHFFAMKYLASAQGKVPSLFEDPMHLNFNRFTLSTSTLTSDALMIGAFGPVIPEGYGIGYGIYDDHLGFIVSAYNTHRNVNEFANCLKESVDDLKTVLDSTS